jgi:hypothetical protein
VILSTHIVDDISTYVTTWQSSALVVAKGIPKRIDRKRKRKVNLNKSDKKDAFSKLTVDLLRAFHTFKSREKTVIHVLSDNQPGC